MERIPSSTSGLAFGIDVTAHRAALASEPRLLLWKLIRCPA